MADSNITKKALATALKELMEEKSFEKINVGDICELSIEYWTKQMYMLQKQQL